MTKIFLVGSNKTGTTSINMALASLGYKVLHPFRVFNNWDIYFNDFVNCRYERLYRLVDNHDVVKDRPFNHGDFYRILDAQYPNSKFILSVREPESWYGSYQRWNKKIGLRDKPFYRLVSQSCYGIDDFIANKEKMIEVYENRNKDIIEYFDNREDFCCISVSDDCCWEKICGLLGKDIPAFSFPHSNRTV